MQIKEFEPPGKGCTTRPVYPDPVDKNSATGFGDSVYVALTDQG